MLFLNKTVFSIILLCWPVFFPQITGVPPEEPVTENESCVQCPIEYCELATGAVVTLDGRLILNV